MPQGRRKVAFSAKKKKDQLHQKRQLKSTAKYVKNHSGSEEESTSPSARKLMEQPQTAGDDGELKRNPNRYNLCFYQESRKQLERLKLEGLQPYKKASPQQQEIDGSIYNGYDFPIRPKWKYNMDKQTLDRNENKYFREYVEKLQEKQRTENKELSLFELNLETWRQLWRVLELSDILLIIVDVRYSTLMFPPALYNYIINTIGKQAILILNKVDLVAAEVVAAWRHYFQTTYPKLRVVIFASNPPTNGKCAQRRRRGIEGVYKIFQECQQIVQGELDLVAWEQKILEDMSTNYKSLGNNEKEMETIVETQVEENESIYPFNSGDSSDGMKREKYYNGVLTLGCIGFPNVGKSSLINALKGRKVVSVSRTPGHTKHFQTIFLTSTVRLCDCPGLVFPSATSKYLQVLLGSFPISQVQVPYPSIRLMAEHLDLPKLLKIHLPEDYDEWSPVAIADAWALKRGFTVAKSSRPDRYRAANHLLRCCVAGQSQLILQFYPPKFNEQLPQWQQDPHIEEIKKYQKLPDLEATEHVDVSESTPESDVSGESNDEGSVGDDESDSEEMTTSSSRNAFAVLLDD